MRSMTLSSRSRWLGFKRYLCRNGRKGAVCATASCGAQVCQSRLSSCGTGFGLCCGRGAHRQRVRLFAQPLLLRCDLHATALLFKLCMAMHGSARMQQRRQLATRLRITEPNLLLQSRRTGNASRDCSMLHSHVRNNRCACTTAARLGAVLCATAFRCRPRHGGLWLRHGVCGGCGTC